MQITLYKCACCGEKVEVISVYVERALGEQICLKCELEREYEIDCMVTGRQDEGKTYE